MIHPTAVVHPKAEIHPTVHIGPYAVIDQHVHIGAYSHIGPHVHITGLTTIGSHTQIFTGAVLGEAPQDLKYNGAPTPLTIGQHNTIREHVTIHRSSHPEEQTQLGDHNLLMAHSHVGHNTRIGHGVILANGALLGGYTTVEDRAFISGNCLVHQFVRVGTLALMQGGSAISKDLPPYTIARGDNAICGLNIIGLRRAGFTPDQRKELKRLYHLLFRGHKHLSHALLEADAQLWSDAAQHLIHFIRESKRGVCQATRHRTTDPLDDH
jgi:UDP-N-acetylglucosamine acyltransferase